MEGIDLTQFAEWFANPLLFVPVIIAFTDALRKRAPAIDGKILVGATTAAIGVALGAVGGLLNVVTVEPFAGGLLGGLLYGLAGGVTAFLGVNVFDLLAGRWGKSSGY